MTFFEYLNFLYGEPVRVIRIAPEAIVFGTLFSIPLIWTVLKIFVTAWVDMETPPVNHSPSNPTQKAA
jgi:hypothetical protein